VLRLLGSGLGLFIAASLMQAMGGRIDYRPVAPHGSLFRIAFSAGGWSGMGDRDSTGHDRSG
jgi:signal transduction histidine kinase